MITILLKKIYIFIFFPAIQLKIILDEYYYKVEPETEVFNNLYQGRYYYFYKDFIRIKEKQIKCVIDMTCEFNNNKAKEFFNENNIKYFNFKTIDWRTVSKDNLEELILIVKENLDKDKKVLINCAFWHRRSFQGVLYYLIKQKWYNFKEAFSLVKNKRIVSSLNFMQLKKFKKYL